MFFFWIFMENDRNNEQEQVKVKENCDKKVFIKPLVCYNCFFLLHSQKTLFTIPNIKREREGEREREREREGERGNRAQPKGRIRRNKIWHSIKNDC